MYSKATLALFAALTATVSVAALPTSYGYVELAERDFGYENADLVERDFYDADLVERDFYDADFEELAARQDPSAPPVDPAAAQAQLAPPTPVTSAAQPGQGRHGHGHGHGHGGHGHGHGKGLGGHGHGHGHGFKHPAHHFKSDGSLKSKSGRRRANRKHRKAQEAAAAAQGGPQAPAPAPVDPSAGAPQMAPPVATRELVLEERGLLESLGLKARVVDLTVKQNSKMNKAKTDCDTLTTKKDKRRCKRNLDQIIQLTKERNYKIGEFIKQTSHHDVFLDSDPNAVPPTSASTPSSRV